MDGKEKKNRNGRKLSIHLFRRLINKGTKRKFFLS